MATTGMFDWNPKSQLQLQQEYLQGIVGDNPDSSYRMGAEIGASLGRLFGGKTAQEAEQNIMKDVFSQAAQEQDPVKRLQTAAALFRQKGMEGRAQQLEAQLMDVKLKSEQTRKATAEAGQAEWEAERYKKFTEELGNLPPDASDEDILGVAVKYGDPKSVLTAVNTRVDKEAARKQALEIKKAELAARAEQAQRESDRILEVARMNNASREDIARLMALSDERAARIAAEGRKEIAQLSATLKGGKTLPASLQKSEDADYETIDTAVNLNASIDPVIKMLGGFGEKAEKPELNLSAAKNAAYSFRNFFGKSSPESLAYAQLQETKTRIINDSLRLNKGTQTEGDAQRAANEVEAAFAKNDTEATRKAMLRLYKINEKAVENKNNQITRRRKSQGIEAPVGTKDNPIVLE
jgi:hypothetical protein